MSAIKMGDSRIQMCLRIWHWMKSRPALIAKYHSGFSVFYIDRFKRRESKNATVLRGSRGGNSSVPVKPIVRYSLLRK